MEGRKSVRFLLPHETGPFRQRDHHSIVESRDICGRPLLPSVPSHNSKGTSNGQLPPLHQHNDPRNKDHVCSKHRKPKTSKSSKGFGGRKLPSKTCHHDYEDIDVAQSMSTPLFTPCHHQSMRAQSASPQLTRRTNVSRDIRKSSSSPCPTTSVSDFKKASKNNFERPLEYNKTCSHLNTEIIRQRSCIPSTNHYSDSHGMGQSVNQGVEKANNYYFLPPRDPMLTSFIDSEDVLKREVISELQLALLYTTLIDSIRFIS